ncbi:transcriptional regulator, partial [Enterobacter cloacae]|uniref:winged helix-turn-helix domain-containing protein n=1 Tax=Enterobacter cloacae TaxID=550 RepID=UPI002A425115|nr:transcriptional regulator [Enterobacter cloacae]
MFWIINDNIKFCPENNLLVSMTRPELSVILTTPASRCLVLLLESAPEVVNQRDLFTKVWGEAGMLVPA